jgi:hypothetical protein
VTPFEHKKKTAKFVLAVLLMRSKGITRATNAPVRLAQKYPNVHPDFCGKMRLTI